jgi:thiopurine S-methyltransferase
MTPEFWHQRWQLGETGWHSDAVNRHLTEYWPGLAVAKDARVLVPLCGKSLDMLWLAGEGHRVVGVELSAAAADAFFSENGLSAVVTDLAPHPFQRWSVDEITLLVGDFFDLSSEVLRAAGVSGIDAVYDRASLIALPPDLRERYARHLIALLRDSFSPRAPRLVLLVTFDYDQARMPGPPFAVAAGEVRRLFEPDFRIDELASLDALQEGSGFAARGLDRLAEHVYRLALRGDDGAA